MGDTVLFEDEIAPAMDAAFAHCLDVTAPPEPRRTLSPGKPQTTAPMRPVSEHAQ